jgi:peptidyl-prolyl cis-trans isomerase SurA
MIARSLALASLLIAGVAVAQTAPTAPPTTQGQKVDGVAAVVDNEVVLQSEVDEQLYLFLQQQQGRPDSSQVQQLRKDILDKLIDDRVIVSEAKRQNLTASEAEIEKNVSDAIADTKKRLGSDDAFLAELRREGMSEADLRKRYRDEVQKQLLANALLRKQLGKMEITPAEAEKYFNENKDKFPRRPSAIKAQVIQIPIEPRLAREGRGPEARSRHARPHQEGRAVLAPRADVVGRPGHRAVGRRSRLVQEGLARLDVRGRGVQGAGRPGVGRRPDAVRLPPDQGRGSRPAKGEIHARHILFRIQPTEADANRSKAQIEQIRAQAVKGVDFGTLARRYSKYKGPAGTDGDLGYLPLSVFSSDFRAALDTLELGEVSPILLNPQGFHLFKVNDRQAERAYTVDEVKQDLPELVRQQKLKEQYDTFVADLRKKAHIEYR